MKSVIAVSCGLFHTVIVLLVLDGTPGWLPVHRLLRQAQHLLLAPLELLLPHLNAVHPD